MHPNPPPKTQHIAQVGKFSSRHRRRNKSVSPFPFSLLLFSPFVHIYCCSPFIPFPFLPLPLLSFHPITLYYIAFSFIPSLSFHLTKLLSFHIIAIFSITLSLCCFFRHHSFLASHCSFFHSLFCKSQLFSFPPP